VTSLQQALDDAYRREWAFVLAATVRVAGDIDLAEECVQEAFVSAIDAWAKNGVPDKPGAWLTTTARRKVLDAHRRDKTLRAKLPLLVEPDAEGANSDNWLEGAVLNDSVVPDDRLRLIFTCCHPALAHETQVALTLRLVCGLSTQRIARAFLVSEPTMAARITRGKKKIKGARIPFRLPQPADLAERLDAVLSVIHLFFTAGHTASSGETLVDEAVVDRAIDMSRMLYELLPEEPEVQGLLALLMLTDARKATRTGPDGELVLLADQDRTQWNVQQIVEGTQLVTAALTRRPAGRFALQAAIAGTHAQAPTYAATDWSQIVGLYDLLLVAWPTPVVALNRAVAVSMAEGPQRGLDELDLLSEHAGLANYVYFAASRADLLRQLGRNDEAVAAYEQALRLVENEIERDYLDSRLLEVGQIT